VCAQAGVGLSETSPDEDILAIDCAVEYPEAPVRVQVKCTSQLGLERSSFTVPIDDKWRSKWARSLFPGYLLLVVVPAEVEAWIEHLDTGTLHNTAAFWTRLPTEETTVRSISIPRAQRMTQETLGQWHHALIAAATPKKEDE